MKAARDFVGIIVEFATGVKFCQHDLCSGFAVLVHIRGNTAPVIDHRHRVVDMDLHMNLSAVSRQSFINGIVDNFVNQVVKSIQACRADIHRGALPHRLETFQNLNLLGPVISRSSFSCLRFRLV